MVNAGFQNFSPNRESKVLRLDIFAQNKVEPVGGMVVKPNFRGSAIGLQENASLVSESADGYFGSRVVVAKYGQSRPWSRRA